MENKGASNAITNSRKMEGNAIPTEETTTHRKKHRRNGKMAHREQWRHTQKWGATTQEKKEVMTVEGVGNCI